MHYFLIVMFLVLITSLVYIRMLTLPNASKWFSSMSFSNMNNLK